MSEFIQPEGFSNPTHLGRLPLPCNHEILPSEK